MISVIITLYNRERSIEAAIESCLRQSCKYYEIIIIDDGSTDSSANKVKKYLCDHVKYFYQDNLGAAAAKNRGVKESSFDYVTFLDSDDEYFCNDALKIIYEKLKEDVDFISCKKILIRKNSNDYILTDKFISDHVNIRNHLLASPLNYAGHNPYVFKKKKFFEAGGFDSNSKWGDALIFWRRFFSLQPRIKFIYEPLYVYNQIDSNSISRNRSPKYYSVALDVMHRCYLENIFDIENQKSEKIWQLIFIFYALKSREVKKILNLTCLLLSGRFYYIPQSFIYLLKTKVIK